MAVQEVIKKYPECFQGAPDFGGDYHKKADFVVSKTLSTSGGTTNLGFSVPVGAIIRGVSAKIITTIAGVSTSGVTVALAFSGGSTLSVGSFVSSGDGNVAAGTKLTKLYDYAASNAVTSTTANLTLTISGGADNTPSAGAIRAVVYYDVLDALK